MRRLMVVCAVGLVMLSASGAQASALVARTRSVKAAPSGVLAVSSARPATSGGRVGDAAIPATGSRPPVRVPPNGGGIAGGDGEAGARHTGAYKPSGPWDLDPTGRHRRGRPGSLLLERQPVGGSGGQDFGLAALHTEAAGAASAHRQREDQRLPLGAVFLHPGRCGRLELLQSLSQRAVGGAECRQPQRCGGGRPDLRQCRRCLCRLPAVGLLLPRWRPALAAADHAGVDGRSGRG